MHDIDCEYVWYLLSSAVYFVDITYRVESQYINDYVDLDELMSFRVLLCLVVMAYSTYDYLMYGYVRSGASWYVDIRYVSNPQLGPL